MSSQGTPTTLVYMAYNTSTGAYVTGDVSHHTLRFVQDGTEATPTNSPAEVDATNAPGAYKLALTAGETLFNTVWLGGKSSAANVIIQPVTVTFESSSNIKKNTASSGFMVVMTVGNPPVPTAGLVVSGLVSIDGAAFQSLTNAVTEVGTGVYTVNLAAADTNGNHLMLLFTASGANNFYVEVITQP